jgi:hypothetical protein
MMMKNNDVKVWLKFIENKINNNWCRVHVIETFERLKRKIHSEE